MSNEDLQYHHATKLPADDVLRSIIGCMKQFMRESPLERWHEKCHGRDGLLIQWVCHQGAVVAFKAGYLLRPGLFYSWLGGVLPQYRNRGIANALIVEQHRHAQNLGCNEVRTITTNHHKAMMICNLKRGFDIIETKVRGDEVRVVMAKKLVSIGDN